MLEIVILSAVIFSLPVSPKDFTLYEIIAPGSFHGERTARLIYAEGAVIDSENDWDYETDRMLARACFS